MEVFNVLAALTALAAVFSWLNHRFLKLPTTIGLLVISMVFSLGMVLLGAAGVTFQGLRDLLLTMDFDEALLHGMLGALLFAGASRFSWAARPTGCWAPWGWICPSCTASCSAR
jgi:CPA1 family monovalent cation:H+ antiporter